MKYIFTILFILPFSTSADDLTSIEDYLIKFNTENICNNTEYTSCVNITKENCIQSFKSAINLCISKMHTDARVPSPVCITNNYVKNADIKDKTKACEHIAAKMAADYKAKHMPNN